MPTVKDRGCCNDSLFFYMKGLIMSSSVLRLYEINDDYIQYLVDVDDKIAQTKIENRTQSRKYIGILFEINGLNYFANLSSYKPKHNKMKETIDFIKIGTYAVINLNNMLPVINGQEKMIDFNNITDIKYRSLLQKEARIISKKAVQIIKNAKIVYNHKTTKGNETSLAKRCCDFKTIELAANKYLSQNT